MHDSPPSNPLRLARALGRAGLAVAVLAFTAVSAATTASAATLTADLPSGQPAGTTVTFTIGGSPAPHEVYRLSIGRAGEPGTIRVMYDYFEENVLEWTPVDVGQYVVVAAVRDLDAETESFAGMTFEIGPADPQVQFQGVALPTSHPLVALYGAPNCPEPAKIRVRFFSPAVGNAAVTALKDCLNGLTNHFYVAGMRENTDYQMQHQILAPDNVTVLGQSPFIPFTTGAAAVTVSPQTLTIPFDLQSSLLEQVLWHSPIIGNQGLGLLPYIYATDLDGEVIWYVENDAWSWRPGNGGTFWHSIDDPFREIEDNVLRKIDLLDNTVKRVNVAELNRQLADLGLEPVNDIHHDARDLPDGNIAIISTAERLLTDVQGPGTLSVIGDMIIVMDQDLQIVWTWSGWDHLDQTRLATQGEICTPGQGGCPPFFLDPDQTNDWMHSNAVAYTPDGNLILSVRHQDWVVKINYDNGAGDGTVLWKLGPEGDFTLTGGNEDDWFSHTHDPSFISPTEMLVYDNSNLRCDDESPPPDCRSRGQVWEIDETAMTATLVYNKDLAGYASAVGSAQRLLNGNYSFNSGFLGSFGAPVTTIEEVQPNGTTIFQVDQQTWQYRSHRMINLYTAPPYWGTPP